MHFGMAQRTRLMGAFHLLPGNDYFLWVGRFKRRRYLPLSLRLLHAVRRIRNYVWLLLIVRFRETQTDGVNTARQFIRVFPLPSKTNNQRYCANSHGTAEHREGCIDQNIQVQPD